MSNKNMQAKNSRVAVEAFKGWVAMMEKIKQDKQFVLAGLAIGGQVHIVEDLTILDVAADFGSCAIKLLLPVPNREQWFDTKSVQLYRVYAERINPIAMHPVNTVPLEQPPGAS